MKQKDIAIIVAVVIFGAFIAVIASKFLIRDKDRKQKVEVVQAISADFTAPDARYFNNKALDPTQLIEIGDNVNTDPFKDTPGR